MMWESLNLCSECKLRIKTKIKKRSLYLCFIVSYDRFSCSWYDPNPDLNFFFSFYAAAIGNEFKFMLISRPFDRTQPTMYDLFQYHDLFQVHNTIQCTHSMHWEEKNKTKHNLFSSYNFSFSKVQPSCCALRFQRIKWRPIAVCLKVFTMEWIIIFCIERKIGSEYYTHGLDYFLALFLRTKKTEILFCRHRHSLGMFT